MRKAFISALLGTAILQMVAPAAQAEIVGTMTAMQTRIAGQNGKTLRVGSGISLGDKLTSNKTGLGMIVFKDESSAKIGPNSQLIIDEFVYQPGRSKGSIGVKMKSGLVRFYGGQISKGGSMKVITPHIVLGVRGGILDTMVDKNVTRSVLRAGRMFCSVNGKTRVVTKPGFACVSDGKTLTIEKLSAKLMDILDSQDRIAGNGIPGRLGNEINARAACISGSSDSSSRCKSENGSLPGIDGKHVNRRNPNIPLGCDPSDISPYPYPGGPYPGGPCP